jgi:hypothetical protein
MKNGFRLNDFLATEGTLAIGEEPENIFDEIKSLSPYDKLSIIGYIFIFSEQFPNLEDSNSYLELSVNRFEYERKKDKIWFKFFKRETMTKVFNVPPVFTKNDNNVIINKENERS